ncbi:hypothetical protein KZO01_08170 [Kurthia zopfii]|uniref:TnsE C-terminal domain-containing protein n=1 Tax=Kurthia zopfii TaxID=1650 RepID=A0A8B4QEI7_9BACL|nr:Tn7-like element transposition protein TnsE [Kurthia zopfii]PWI22287.1 hypothetical protein DF281_07980 [Kurthia zopfii]TDR37898.1 hypothetical protein DFR61_11824 [Kurthia zopfii]GEK30508.1 hypothetical protein KZO01_08170 [Kurthia zopfii]STX11085.1 Uncharacterised protein [Kurthia zopfii]
MSSKVYKLKNWPFPKGEPAQLIWIGSPFKAEKKMMVYVHFRAKGKTKKIAIDWGVLPALAIQHMYIDGDLRYSLPPDNLEEIDLMIFPQSVRYTEREWVVQGTNDQDISRSFIVNFNNKSYTLPLIEVVRSILAPNRFLLYRLFEMNSFPQYFIENYSEGQIHLDFSSQYNLKYTKKSFLYQLVWLLGNRDLRRTFENIAYTFLNTGELKFDWLFQQPISIKAIVKITSNGGTILRVTEVKDKEIPFEIISFSHPEVSKSEKTNEPKKYTMHELKSSAEEKEKMIDETVEGATEDFELIEMNKQVHKYAESPSIVKVQGKSTKQRTYEDESTKRYTFKDSGIRSASDTGGNRLARGIENQSLQQAQAEGELGEFVYILQELEDYKEVQSINVQLSSLPIGDGNRVFSYLEDGITPRRYALATVNLFNGNEFKILEVERENRALSMLILFATVSINWNQLIDGLLLNLVNSSGSWERDVLGDLKRRNIVVRKAKHSKKGYKHRARLLFNKVL